MLKILNKFREIRIDRVELSLSRLMNSSVTDFRTKEASLVTTEYPLQR